MEVKRPFSDADWLATPEAVRRYIEHLEQVIEEYGRLLQQQQERIEKIESRLNRDSPELEQASVLGRPLQKAGEKGQKEQTK